MTQARFSAPATIWQVVVLLRVPLIVTIILVVALLDVAFEGSMREAMRYAVYDRPEHLAAIALALLLAVVAIRFTGEAMVAVVAPELSDEVSLVGTLARRIPSACALAVALALGAPMMLLGELNAGLAGAAYIAIGLTVALIRGPFPALGFACTHPGDPLRIALGVPPFLLAVVLSVITVGLFSKGTVESTLQRYDAGGALRLLVEAIAVFFVCYGVRVASEIMATTALAPIHGGRTRSLFAAAGRVAALVIGLLIAVSFLTQLPPTYFSPAPYGFDPAYNAVVAAILMMALVAVLAAFGDIAWSFGPAASTRIAESWRLALFHLSSVPLRGRFLMAALFVMAVAVTFELADLTRPDHAQSVGTVALLLAWGCAVCGLFAPVAMLSHLTRVPLLFALVAAGVAFSFFDLNDNHTIRKVQKSTSSAVELPVENYFGEILKLKTWLDSRQDLNAYRDREYPVFLIATEGGGIRAAHFTASVLAALQERCPAFAQHTLGISSVSGGSVGAAIFAGLAAKHARNAIHGGCGSRPAEPGPFLKPARQILQNDFLAPLVGAALFPDALARILPQPMDSFDRARALEYGFERAWNEAVPDDPTMGSSIKSLYDQYSEMRPPVPHLFLNATEVETGNSVPYRTATLCDGSTIGLNALDCAKDRGIPNVYFRRALQGIDDDLPLSVAAILSARFPYLTPAARFPLRGRYVDGGYFENSGTWYAGVIAQHLLDQKIPDEPTPVVGPKSRIVIIVIRSTPYSSLPVSARAPDGLNEVLSPIRTLLNTRGARAEYSRSDVERLLTLVDRMQCASSPRGPQRGCDPGVHLVELGIPADVGVGIPLTWTLSSKSRAEMDEIIDKMRAGDSKTPFGQIVCLLDPAGCSNRSPSSHN